jgi:hypothetical protein
LDRFRDPQLFVDHIDTGHGRLDAETHTRSA